MPSRKPMESTILGLPGKWAENNFEISDHYTTKIGGIPDWPSKELVLKSGFYKCSLCAAKLCLVTQVYAPISLENLNIDERVIYIFACPMQECARNPLSWRTVRVQKRQNFVHSDDENSTENHVSKINSKYPVCERGSRFSNDSSDSDVNLEELGHAFQKVSLLTSCKKQNGSTKSKATKKNVKAKKKLGPTDVTVIPCFYIYSQEESSTSVTINEGFSSLSLKENDSRSQIDDDKWEGELYEYDRALGVDRTYLKFKKKLDMYPEQCFRYLFGGKPLFAAQTVNNSSICKVCGSMRHFEMQLMPPLLYFLQEVADDASVHFLKDWDWMTIIIYTCSKSCFQESGRGVATCWTVVEESTFIQYDDLSDKIRDRIKI